MILNKLKLAGIFLFLFTAGCIKKDDLTLPVRVQLRIGVTPDDPLNNDFLNFNSCKIGIQSIQFEGKREAGADIFFVTDSRIDFQDLLFLKPVIISDFDIPQGIYNSMKWDISMNCLDTRVYFDCNEEYYQCKGIIFTGTYTYFSGNGIPIVFAIDKPVQFSIRASDPDDNARIVLSVKKVYEATVLIALEDAFRSISRESLEKAEISYYSGNNIMLISSSKNTSLYEILSYRIFQSAKVIVDDIDSSTL